MDGGEWLALCLVVLPLGKGDRCTHWIGESVGLITGLDAVLMR
jgi:hypothetical protein